ncbi:MAG: hypothetical protein NVSMB31_13720 [Vulcanimicrobiaceae bacterium]
MLRTSGDRVDAIARVFHAPRAQLFEAWTRPELLSQWWSGARGGYPFSGVYHDISRPDRLVFTHPLEDDAGQSQEATVTVTFLEVENLTRVTIIAESQSVATELPPPGALDRLADMLERHSRIQRGVATLRGASVVESTIEVVGDPNAMRRSINSSK